MRQAASVHPRDYQRRRTSESVRETAEGPTDYTLDRVSEIRAQLQQADLTRRTAQRLFESFIASREHFIGDLVHRYSRKSLAEIAGRTGCPVDTNMTILDLATVLYRSSLRVFLIGDPIDSDLRSPEFETDVANTVVRLTDDQVAASVSWLHDTAGYRWPANRITVAEARELRRLANQLNRPVNQLIREAIQQYTATMNDQTE